MIGFLALALTLGLANEPMPFTEAEKELSEDITIPELKAHVYRLASPDFLGRRGPGAARAAKHIAEAFERIKLQPAFEDSYYQDIPWLLADKDKPSFVGRNVAGFVPGSDPDLKNEWIIVSAHFDHMGKTDDILYPGADDNASGVAMLLEVAEKFALAKEKPKRSLCFVAFDQEEFGLQGSTHFATHPPRDIKKLKAFITADMLGRSMANVMTEYVFVMGSERSTKMRKLIEEVKPPDGLKTGRLGADLVGTRSDYGPFRDRSVPFLFFSTGQHPDYHQPSDTPDKIQYDKLQRISVLIGDLAARLANDADSPVWLTDALGPDLDEVNTVLTLLKRVLENPKIYPLNVKQKDLVGDVEKQLSDIMKRGKVTLEERTGLVWSARLLLTTVF
jgi:hypothetical protein